MDNVMKVVLSSGSYTENLKNNIYYDKVSRGYGKFSYIGLYKEKSVRAVGKIENIIQANLVNDFLIINKSLNQVSDDQKRRIKETIIYVKGKNFDISIAHNFFLVEQFEFTDFRKISSGAPQGSKKFNLIDLLGSFDNNDIKDLAKKLNIKKW